MRSTWEGRRIGFVLLFTLSSILVAMSLSHMAYSDVEAEGSPDTCSGGCKILLYEDFEEYNLSQPPPNWTVEIPGYGIGGIYVEESFQKDNQRLHVMSSANNRAIISHNLTPTSPHLEVALKVNIVEEDFFPEITEPVAFSLGFKTNSSGRIAVLELGRSDNQTVFPFNHSYDQGAWVPIRVTIDLESSSTATYIWLDPIGNATLPPLDVSDIQSFYLHLGRGAWYKGRFDDIEVREYEVAETTAIAGFLAVFATVAWRLRASGPDGPSRE